MPSSLKTHTLEVPNVPDEVIQQLDARAQARGEDRAGYVLRLIEKDIATAATLRELFAPVREDIRASGMTEEEVDDLLEEAREEAYQSRRVKRGKP